MLLRINPNVLRDHYSVKFYCQMVCEELEGLGDPSLENYFEIPDSWCNLAHFKSKIFAQKHFQIFVLNSMSLICLLTLYVKVAQGQVILFHCGYGSSIQRGAIP